MKFVIAIASVCAAATAQQKPRVYITDSESWQVRAGAGNSWGAASGGARPQTAEIYKTFGASCPQVMMTNNRDRADYVVTLDHEGGKGYLRKDNKVAVFSKDGDMLYSGSTRSLGNSVKDACQALTKSR
jgi:hypothetical protein